LDVKESKRGGYVMKIKYVKFNMTPEARELLRLKQRKFNETASLLAGKKTRIPLTKLMTLMMKKPIWFDNQEIKNIITKKRGRKICL
jgi:hypothetical protein